MVSSAMDSSELALSLIHCAHKTENTKLIEFTLEAFKTWLQH